MPEVLELDISRLVIGPKGIDPFYAPFSPGDLGRFREALLSRVFAALADSPSRRREEVELALVLILEFLREVLALYYSGTLVRRARADGVVHISVPPGCTMLAAVSTGGVPDPRQRRTWQLLARGIPDPIWRRPLRLARNLLLRDEFSRRPLPAIDLQHDIVTPAVSPLIRRHARSLAERVCLVPARSWFPPLPDPVLENAGEQALGSGITETLLEAVSKAYRDAGESLPTPEKAYLGRWLEVVSGLCRAYLDRLLDAPQRIPGRLWTGTGGIIWMRLLRLACRRLGGEITGHEHGTASPAESISIGLWEFEFCDRFVTFTPEMAQRYRQPHHHRYRVFDPAPAITDILTLEGGSDRSENTPARLEVPRSRPRRVMYVNTIYFGDAPGFTPAFPDPVWVDWQARLMTRLKMAGYEVLLKPHPECRLRPAPAFEALADGVLYERMEQVQEQADLFLFDWVQTTTLVQALATDIPIVVIDFGFTSFEPEAEALFRRRCAVVRGWVDDAGRAQVDEHELLQALEAAIPKAGDRAFFHHYQGGMAGV
ncbi:MAG: hypothetical protein D6786_10740 [Gammaproteobacteria bacterium]|nr:MAG: hypothetical protein D6786_10740 [Gammaproteobacteria bacterium]